MVRVCCFLALVIASCQVLAAPRLLFYAPFDRGTNARLAAGDPRGRGNTEGRVCRLEAGRGELWGRALAVPLDKETPRQLRYDALRNVRTEEGTISFFARIDDFGTHWQEHRFVVIGSDAYKNGLVLGVHPQGPHLVFSWCFNQTTGWFHVREVLREGEWHHIAATWAPAAEGKVRFTVFIDGKRFATTDEAAAFAEWPGDLVVGSAPNGAYALDGAIDDLRIYGSAVDDTDVTAPAGPLSPEELTAANAALGLQLVAGDAVRAPLPPAERAAPVMDGDFEQWQDGKPVCWQVGAGVYRPESAYTISGRTALSMATDRMQNARWLHSSVWQDVVLRPRTRYRLAFWAAKDGTGDVRADVRPLRGGEPASDSVLSFASGWTWFFHWGRVERVFETGPDTAYRLRILQYGAPNRSVYIDGVSLRETGDARAGASREELTRGFLAFTQSPMRPFSIDVPPAADRCLGKNDVLEVVTAAGEREPVLLALHALCHLEGATVLPEGPLRTTTGEELPCERLDIRHLQSPLLRPASPQFVQRAKNHVWWITVDAGEARPGLYEGNVLVVTAGEPAARIGLRVTVLPWSWPEATIAFFAYHAEAYFPREFLSPDLVESYYRDMADHGMTTVTVYGTPDVDGASIDFAHNYKVPREERPEQFALGYDARVPCLLRSGLCRSGQPLILLVSKNGTDQRYGFGAQNESVTRALLHEWAKRQWPTPLLYVHDEPSLPDRIAAVKPVLETIRSWGLPARTVTSGLDIEELGHLYDVWIQAASAIRPETVLRARELDAELWTYNCNTPCTNAAFSRTLHGFWAHRTGVGGVAQWAYYDAKNWFVDGKGQVHGTGGLSRVCPSPEGPVPTVAWEATREGTEDYRCAMAFEESLRQLEQRADSYRAAAMGLLAAEDAELIAKREQQRGRKHDPEREAIVWEAGGDPRRQRGERLLLAAIRLDLERDVARNVRKRVLKSIPFDAMALRGSFSCGMDAGAFVPPIDAGAPVTAPERKRRVLIAGIRRIRGVLGAHATP